MEQQQRNQTLEQQREAEAEVRRRWRVLHGLENEMPHRTNSVSPEERLRRDQMFDEKIRGINENE
jgi:hypothetical protein